MLVDGQRDAAALAEPERQVVAHVTVLRQLRTVVVHVDEVRLVELRPAGCVDDEARRIGRARCAYDLPLEVRRRLAPVLVERDPHHDARMPAQLVDDLEPLAQETPAGDLRREVVAGRHVLRDEQAEAVAPRVPARILDLDVLADEVEAHRLHRLDVGAERVVARRRVDAVRPEALVEHARDVERLAVQLQLAAAPSDRPHADVGAHDVVAGAKLPVEQDGPLG